MRRLVGAAGEAWGYQTSAKRHFSPAAPPNRFSSTPLTEGVAVNEKATRKTPIETFPPLHSSPFSQLSRRQLFAAEDCDGSFKTHMGKMSIYIDKMSGYELADAVRKSLDAYNSCKAGDGFSPHGVWDQIEADMAAKHGK